MRFYHTARNDIIHLPKRRAKKPAFYITLLNSNLGAKIATTTGVAANAILVSKELTFTAGTATDNVSSYLNGKQLLGIALACPSSTSGVAITGAQTDGVNTVTIKARSIADNIPYAGSIPVNYIIFLR